ncbi:Acyl-CoA dehydrogenase [Parafrankia irregularis]|uniref:Acyl-CoA dehydrogenase n=1 Tax=Parafrankia irregularis TaxID=795642 RepID=A0A0S4QUM4_9ACTN|nr:acyl-CoA dehydrogenase family protein [Parafrankia sp. CH37]CUU59296.1 Acyl-CoA dehydrogenase [Parafrankia irregularis]
MRLSLDADQVFFRDTTSKFLADQVPVAQVRRLRDDPAGFDGDYWRRGAELGWTSLLVGEEHGGGTISGDGVSDLVLVADAFGRHAAPGPLVATNVVAAALARALPAQDGTATATALAALVEGSATAAWCVAEPRPNDRLGSVTAQARIDGGSIVLSGVKRPVESAATASYLLATARTDGGLTQVLVPAGTTGLSVAPLRTVDLTRRFFTVTFDDVRLPLDAVVGMVGSAAGEVAYQRQLAAVLGTAESVGAMQAAFDLTVQWAFDRYSFGRQLASYQALKHRFADLRTWLEASHAISDAAAAALGTGAPDAPALVSAAKAFVGDYGSRLLQDCVQLHGGIGLTFEHDLHLFLRRHTVNRLLDGTPAEHRAQLADLVEKVEDEAA